MTSLFLAALLLRKANSTAMASIEAFDDASGRRAKMALSCAAGPDGMDGSGSVVSSFAMGSLRVPRRVSNAGGASGEKTRHALDGFLGRLVVNPRHLLRLLRLRSLRLRLLLVLLPLALVLPLRHTQDGSRHLAPQLSQVLVKLLLLLVGPEALRAQVVVARPGGAGSPSGDERGVERGLERGEDGEWEAEELREPVRVE